MLRQCCEDALSKRGIRHSDPFDWEKSNVDGSLTTTTSSTSKYLATPLGFKPDVALNNPSDLPRSNTALPVGEESLQYDEEDQAVNVQVPEGRQPEVIEKKVNVLLLMSFVYLCVFLHFSLCSFKYESVCLCKYKIREKKCFFIKTLFVPIKNYKPFLNQ